MGQVILTVTLNPAIDVTYHVDELKPGATHRVSRVDERLGGKGVNVASVLGQLGVPAVATGLLHAALGAEQHGRLDAALGAERHGRPDAALGAEPLSTQRGDAFFPIGGATRRTVVVTDGREATGFWEPGPIVTPDEWEGFKRHFDLLLKRSRVVVLSGSLPRGLPESAYATLITMCREARVASILDTSGAALPLGTAAGPSVVKPNADELAELAELGAVPEGTIVVASNGYDGLTGLTWRARPPRRIDGNPTGAGDACVAALARGLLHGTDWPSLLREAVALSAAAVASPVAGLADLELYQELLPQIVVEEI
ncbi:MAG TPA: PfkB family carbohydrate kinase [Candidatus Limnocylindrales bacterium]